MEEQFKAITLNDLVAASADGVLRALEARARGEARFSAVDLVRSGFFVDFHIICGGRPGPLTRFAGFEAGGALGAEAPE